MNFTCPHCAKLLTSEHDVHGLKVECPLCSKRFIVAAKSSESAARTSAPEEPDSASFKKRVNETADELINRVPFTLGTADLNVVRKITAAALKDSTTDADAGLTISELRPIFEAIGLPGASAVKLANEISEAKNSRRATQKDRVVEVQFPMLKGSTSGNTDSFLFNADSSGSVRFLKDAAVITFWAPWPIWKLFVVCGGVIFGTVFFCDQFKTTKVFASATAAIGLVVLGCMRRFARSERYEAIRYSSITGFAVQTDGGILYLRDHARDVIAFSSPPIRSSVVFDELRSRAIAEVSLRQTPPEPARNLVLSSGKAGRVFWLRIARFMNNPSIAIQAGLGLLVSSWLFPPWVYKGGESEGFHFIFEKFSYAVRVDVGRLVLVDLCIVAVCAGVFMALKKSKEGKP
jgi:hypothetical protein